MAGLVMPRAMYTAQFVGFGIEIQCQICQEKMWIDNATPKKDRDRMIVQFRRSHEKAHKENIK